MKYFEKISALGIPNKSIKKSIPSAKDTEWSFVIQQHDADKAGLHFDMRLSDGTTAYSWATRKGLPAVGEKILWVRQPDHTPEYMSFEGEIADGYGKGKVEIKSSTKVHVIKTESGKISFNIYEGHKTKQYHLIHTGGDNWLCINNTPTQTSRPDVPKEKIRAKTIRPEDINFDDDSTILTSKLDGAASIVILRKDKPIEVFSYRRSKRGPELINHTYKFPHLYNKRAPKELDKTVLWGESMFLDSSGKALPFGQIGGLLNMNTWKAKEKIKEEGILPANYIYNVQSFKGKDSYKKPYLDKYKMLKEINKIIPELKLPEIAESSSEKKRLYESIASGRFPLTTEGYVLWPKKDYKPIKAKRKNDVELYAQTFIKGTGKYSNVLGKIGATPDPEGLGPMTNVGGGFTDAERRKIWKNRAIYKGKPMTIEFQNKLSSGKYRMPIFKAWREAEFWPTSNST
jgi:hypothetical protein